MNTPEQIAEAITRYREAKALLEKSGEEFSKAEQQFKEMGAILVGMLDEFHDLSVSNEPVPPPRPAPETLTGIREEIDDICIGIFGSKFEDLTLEGSAVCGDIECIEHYEGGELIFAALCDLWYGFAPTEMALGECERVQKTKFNYAGNRVRLSLSPRPEALMNLASLIHKVQAAARLRD